MNKTICRSAIGSFLFFTIQTASAWQTNQPVIKASSLQASFIIKEKGKIIKKNNWTISPQARPDIFVVNAKIKKTVILYTDIDSISFEVISGKNYDFVVLVNAKDSAFTRIEANSDPEPAEFTRKYIRQHQNTTSIEIPAFYEMVHILFSLTKTAGSDIAKQTGYYAEMLKWFQPYKMHPVIRLFDSLLQRSGDNLFYLKKDAYAFDFNKYGTIVKSEIYNRVALREQNTVQPYIGQLQNFADVSAFHKFYERNLPFYKQQIQFYRDTAGVDKMLSWLNKNFPDTRYQSFKIIFSPLVMGNQSSAWFAYHGFNEAQAHVNFPYPAIWTVGFSGTAAAVKAGNIVFTELNHAFINPEADKLQYATDISKICSQLNKWMDKRAAGSYRNSASCFNEYMNWGLVTLRYADDAPADQLDKLVQNNIAFMEKDRGFIRFGPFSLFLLQLYQKRKPGQVLADLYPDIILWFKNNP